jgi:hypothetical protein
MLLVAAAWCSGCAGAVLDGGDVSLDDEEGGVYVPFRPDPAKADGLAPSLGGRLEFQHACDPGPRLTVAAVGDVLLHKPLQVQAYHSPNRFGSLWSEVADLLGRADVTYANLEGPTAAGVTASGASTTDPGPTFDGVVYASYPQFNYHAALLADLRAAGVDVESTANNHALDRRALGVDRTAGALQQAGLPFTGTRARGATSPDWHTVTRHAGFTIAWLACTTGTNGIPDSAGQVLGCTSDAAEIEDRIRQLAAEPTIDAVIVTPHWGVEYTATPRKEQLALGHRFLEAGALAVLGSHPHVLEPWERHLTRDGRETFVLYSFGNFVSGQSGLAKRSTLLLYLGLTRTASGRVQLNGVRYVPLYMMGAEGGAWTVRAVDRTTGLTQSRALTTSMFGSWNLQPPDEPLVTTPQCNGK